VALALACLLSLHTRNPTHDAIVFALRRFFQATNPQPPGDVGVRFYRDAFYSSHALLMVGYQGFNGRRISGERLQARRCGAGNVCGRGIRWQVCKRQVRAWRALR
jgi:hypothetical protein